MWRIVYESKSWYPCTHQEWCRNHFNMGWQWQCRKKTVEPIPAFTPLNISLGESFPNHKKTCHLWPNISQASLVRSDQTWKKVELIMTYADTKVQMDGCIPGDHPLFKITSFFVNCVPTIYKHMCYWYQFTSPFPINNPYNPQCLSPTVLCKTQHMFPFEKGTKTQCYH